MRDLLVRRLDSLYLKVVSSFQFFQHPLELGMGVILNHLNLSLNMRDSPANRQHEP